MTSSPVHQTASFGFLPVFQCDLHFSSTTFQTIMAAQGYSGFGNAGAYAAGQQGLSNAAIAHQQALAAQQAAAAYGQGFAAQGYAQNALNQQLAAQQQLNQGFAAHQAQLAGYGQSNLAGLQAADIQAQYRGKQAFFDASRGVLYDGQTAYFYAPTGAAVLPGNATSNVYTAIDSANPGAAGYAAAAANRGLILGNNTAGDLAAHRNALASSYAYDGTGYAL
uniref:Uncharacterized protein n=1 Tax=Panagrolaimus sp. JU765 TaxID=591449 RepID=A0AC34QMI4_9BILA